MDLKDKAGKYYTNFEDIASDYLEVKMKKEEMEVIHALMTNDRLPIGNLADIHARYITIPILNEYYFNEPRYFALARLTDTHNSSKLQSTESHYLQEFKTRTSNMIQKIHLRELELEYAKGRIFLTGFNQSPDAKMRALERRNILQEYVTNQGFQNKGGVSKIPENEMDELSRTKALFDELLDETPEEPDFSQKIMTGPEEFMQLSNNLYSFDDCNAGCLEGIIIENGKKMPCPVCQQKRIDYLTHNNRDVVRKKTLRELLNVPLKTTFSTMQMRNTGTYQRVMEIKKKDTVALYTEEDFRNLQVTFSALLDLYVEMPLNKMLTRIESTAIKGYRAMTDDILVIYYHSIYEQKLAKEIVMKREKEHLKTIIIRV